MKPRSPVVGYNHNVRYGGRVWHVQTEDSGVQNPHIFTHLFNGGTIIGSKKTEYDPESDVSAVQKLMQVQHKLMLRDLKSGAFDEKIEKVFGPIVREPETTVAPDTTPDAIPRPTAALQAELETQRDITLQPEVATPAEVTPAEIAPPPRVPDPQAHVAVTAPNVVSRKREDERTTVPNLSPLLSPPAALPPTAQRSPSRPQARLTPAPRPSIVAARSGTSAPPSPTPPPTLGGSRGAPPPRSAPPTIGSGRAGVTQQNPRTAENVVVARPAVIVGNGQKKGEAAQFWKTNERKPERGFGDGAVSERSLDEVILAYLSEDVPKK